jgi:hypothetical protein
MHPLIVVDDKIAGVKRALEDSGYQVRDLSQGWEQAAAIVVSGMDDNFLGRQDIVSRAPVIDAATTRLHKSVPRGTLLTMPYMYKDHLHQQFQVPPHKHEHS